MEGQLWGLVTTYRRPEALARTVSALAAQTRRVDTLVVVDNGASSGGVSESDLKQWIPAARVTLLPQPENRGPAGGIAAGMAFIVEHAGRDDWLVTLDDDDPPLFHDDLERLWKTAGELLEVDPRVAAVGRNGSRFDSRRCRYQRLNDEELTGGPIKVATIGGSQLPLMRVEVVRKVGTYRPDLFFGHEELEFFLRVGQHGWNTYADSGLVLRNRTAVGRTGFQGGPSHRLSKADWRRYYEIRNRVFIARKACGRLTVLRLSLELAAKIIRNLVRQPKDAVAHARLTVAAVGDGLRGRLGASVVPELTDMGTLPVRSNKARSRLRR